MNEPLATPSRPTRRVWLLASLPLLSLCVIAWAFRLPTEPRAVVRLAGDWLAIDALGQGDRLLTEAPTAQWQQLSVPGGFTKQGLQTNDVVVTRTITLPDELQHDDLLFVLGTTRSATVRVAFNGTDVGTRGVPSTGFVGSESLETSFFISRRLLMPGENRISLELKSSTELDGIVDSNLLLGRHDVLVPWVFRAVSVREALEMGGLVLLVFLVLQLALVWQLQGSSARRALLISTLALVATTLLYGLAKTGLFVSSFCSPQVIFALVAVSVYLIGLTLPEFIERYYSRPLSWPLRINRPISGLMVALCLPLRAAAPHFEARLYSVYAAWLMFIILYEFSVSLRDLLRGTTRLGPVMTISLAVAAGTALGDLITDLGLASLPRLFTQGIVNLGVGAAMVVITDFMKMAQENRLLSGALKVRNVELSTALQKAEESARIKAEFLASTSHELRTPLNAIINIPQGLLEHMVDVRSARCAQCGLVTERDANADPNEGCPACKGTVTLSDRTLKLELEPTTTARLLKSVVTSGEHLLSVVNDILDFSKLDANRMTLVREAVELNELVETAIFTLQPVAQRSGVTLEFSGRTPPVTLEVDRVKLMQVLINLLGNAMKFSDGRGTVQVRIDSGPTEVKVSVTDQGIGIAPEFHAVIFEGFRQVEGGSTRRFGGTGLGLAISRRLIELHGGRIELASQPGHGATFTICLPFAAPRTDQSPSAQRVVLLIDDDASAVDAASAVLAPRNFRVVGVRDPRLAIEQARALAPVLIVLDVMMPRLSGIEVLQQLKSDPALARIPVIVASAYADNREATLALGARFLPKPWNADLLMAEVRDLLGLREP